jgi:hypothetical protein
MFRPLYAHHQEVEIVSMQHLVSSLSESDRPVHRLRENVSSLATCAPDGHFPTVTVPDAASIQFQPPDDEHIMLETCRGM